MLQTTLAGSLPKPSWLAEPERAVGAVEARGRRPRRRQARRDASSPCTTRRMPGIDIVSDGEQARRAFRARLPRQSSTASTSSKKTVIGIRDDRYDADVPTVVGAVAPQGPGPRDEARAARAHTGRKLKFTLPGPMTIVDTLSDAHYGSRREARLRLRRAS